MNKKNIVKAQTSGYQKNFAPPKAPVNEGYRLDGKARKSECSTSEPMSTNVNQASADGEAQRGMPDYDYKIGLLRLGRFIEEIAPEPVIFYLIFLLILLFLNLF